jgi:peptidyl-prolyl cis-trans isomerase A (cyclophilin A)
MDKYRFLFAFLFVICTHILAHSQKVIISTSKGKIEIELYCDKAPITVANFLQYVKDGAYDGGSFYRVVTKENQSPNQPHIEVIQGGTDADSTKRKAPIALERTSKTGLKHLNGTISMARSAPNSATSEFFICLNEQPSLDFGGNRNPDGQGFAAFGKVTKGMKVVKKIQKGKTTYLPSLGLNQRLIKPITINHIKIID